VRLEEELMELDFLKNDSNNVIIEEAKYKKISKEICLSLVLDRAICLNCYKALVEKIKSLVKPIKVKSLLIGYKDDVLDETNYLEYLNEILEELSSNNALYKAYDAKDAKIDGRNILFLVPKDDLTINDLANPIKDKFADYGLDVNVCFKPDENKSYESQIAELDNQIEEALAAQRKEAQQASNFNAQIKQVKKNYRSASPMEKSSISNIPSTETELDKYKNESGEPVFMINAYVYGIEFKDFKNTKSILASIKVTDDTKILLVFLKSLNSIP
jgi:DNA polymerase III alpha subunit (gram-positive type)